MYMYKAPLSWCKEDALQGLLLCHPPLSLLLHTLTWGSPRPLNLT